MDEGFAAGPVLAWPFSLLVLFSMNAIKQAGRGYGSRDGNHFHPIENECYVVSMDKDAAPANRPALRAAPPLVERPTQLVWSGLMVCLFCFFVANHVIDDRVDSTKLVVPSEHDGQDLAGWDHANRSMGICIDLNEATSRELSLLPGIGPKMASRILTDRRQNGRFQSVSDLSRVSGIGPRTIERIGFMVEVREPALSIASVQRSVRNSSSMANSN